MSRSKIEVIQAVYAAFGRGDVDAILGAVTEDVDWQTESEMAIAPWHGPHKGKSELLDFFVALGASVEVLEFTPLTFAENDADVLVVVRFVVRSRATGKSGQMNLHHWFHFRDGLIASYRGSEDTAVVADLLTT